MCALVYELPLYCRLSSLGGSSCAACGAGLAGTLSVPPSGEMSPSFEFVQTLTTARGRRGGVPALFARCRISFSTMRSVNAALSPEKSRFSSPKEVSWIAKFDHTPIGRPSGSSTRITVMSGSIEASRAASSSCGTSWLRRKGSKLRLRDASVSWALPIPSSAGTR